MKKELLQYHSFIENNQIVITGTPQFEGHYKKDTQLSRHEFYAKYNLDKTKEYICYSGDDITTSPDDPQYLNDLAIAVHQLNKNGKSLGIVFRKCPTDFSNRYDKVLRTFEDIIKPIAPIWEKQGNLWNTILPKLEDVALLQNTAKHCKAVVNIGSSMVFDFVIHENPCFYVNYDAKNKIQKDWSTERIYSFIHFRSMPEKSTVYWLDSPRDIKKQLEVALEDSHKVLPNTKKWFKKINIHPPERASLRIWKAIEIITN